MKKIKKKIGKIGITVSILLLIIGSVYAKNSTEDSSNVLTENTPNISIGDTPNISIGDINGSNAKEDIALEEGGVLDKNITGNSFEEGGTEKKPSPGFGSIITVIIFLSAIVIIRRR